MEPVIQMRELSHFYGTGSLRRQVLHNLSADFMPGEIVILTGPSGSGKTTILTLAGALRSVTHGSLLTLKRELKNAGKNTLLQVRKQIGFIFQAHNLINALTSVQNVQMSLEMDRSVSAAEANERCHAILAAVGLADHAHKRPNELSGGQRQRVAIARALVRQPLLVLADEPTAALDKKSGREVVDLLQSLAKQRGCTILLVTHDNRILDIADRIMTLEDGRLTSFTSGMTANTDNLLTAFAEIHRKGDLARQVSDISDEAFLQFLEKATEEFAGFLGTMDLANQRASTALFDEVLEAVTLRVRMLLGADRATIYLVDDNKQELYSKVAHHVGEEPLEIRVSIHTGIAGRVALTGEVLNIPDAYESPFFLPSVDRETGYRTKSVLCMPIRDRAGKVFAVAQLLNKEDGQAFSADDERRFVTFAGPLGIILESCCRLAAGAQQIS